MTEKRFKLIADSNLKYLMQAELDLPIYDYSNDEKRLSLKDTLDLLNKLSTEKNELKEKLNSISDIIDEQMSIGEVLEMLNNLYDENEELYEENKRLREILEYGKIDCKHLVSYEEGDYCKKTGDWFFDFEGYEDDCPTCKYCERK